MLGSRRALPCLARAAAAGTTQRGQQRALSTAVTPGLRSEALAVVKEAGGKPLHTREVLAALEARLGPESPLRAKLTMTHLKKAILRSLEEGHAIRTVAVREEGKRKAQYGWVISKHQPGSSDKPAAAAGKGEGETAA